MNLRDLIRFQILEIFCLGLVFEVAAQVKPQRLQNLNRSSSKEKFDLKTENDKLNVSFALEANWPHSSVQLGSVSAVTFDVDGNVVVFHRVDRLWSQTTFNDHNIYTQQNSGPISQNTVLAIDKTTGKIVYEWGKNLFYMPHGLTIDHQNNAWVTDVALHQVMKFGPKGSLNKPLLVLGTQFTPGQGDKFCKPTSVAVLESGDFFVADGYCNARIIKYSKTGEKLLTWGENSFRGNSFKTAPKNFFAIPHALTLIKSKDLVCTADRENGRIQCFSTLNGTFDSQYYSQVIGDRLFSMDYSEANNGQFFIVNGPTRGVSEVHGYVMDFSTKKVVSKFGANNWTFSNPHDIAVTKDGNQVYVVELNPYKVYKFCKIGISKSTEIYLKPTVTQIDPNESQAFTSMSDSSLAMGKGERGSVALLVVILIFIFGVLTVAMTLLISRRRKRGKDRSTPSTGGIEYNKLVSGCSYDDEC